MFPKRCTSHSVSGGIQPFQAIHDSVQLVEKPSYAARATCRMTFESGARMTISTLAKVDEAGIKAFLFKRLVPLSRDEHERIGLSSHRSYREYHFQWLPIVVSEVVEAARHFPIILADTQKPMLGVVVGLHQRQSLFIDRHGNWTGGYLPLYLRQMPFHIVKIRGASMAAQPAICLDMDSPLVDESFPDKIVEGDRLAASTQDQLAAAMQFEQDARASAAFADALERSGLTVPLSALPEAADCLALRSLQAVSAARLRETPSQSLAAIFTPGAQPILQACAQSTAHFATLRQLQERSYADREAQLRADL